MVREGLLALLSSEKEFKVLGQASTGKEAIDLVKQMKPDIVIMDLNMPEINGLEATRIIRSSILTTRIIILSMYSDPVYVNRALRAGAHGYLIKQSAAGALLEAVKEVCSGKKYFSPELRPILKEQTATIQLTKREMETLKFIAQGKTGREIARELNLHFKTVDTYRQRLMKKLGLHDIASLTRYALKNNLV